MGARNPPLLLRGICVVDRRNEQRFGYKLVALPCVGHLFHSYLIRFCVSLVILCFAERGFMKKEINK